MTHPQQDLVLQPEPRRLLDRVRARCRLRHLARAPRTPTCQSVPGEGGPLMALSGVPHEVFLNDRSAVAGDSLDEIKIEESAGVEGAVSAL